MAIYMEGPVFQCIPGWWIITNWLKRNICIHLFLRRDACQLMKSFIPVNQSFIHFSWIHLQKLTWDIQTWGEILQIWVMWGPFQNFTAESQGFPQSSNSAPNPAILLMERSSCTSPGTLKNPGKKSVCSIVFHIVPYELVHDFFHQLFATTSILLSIWCQVELHELSVFLGIFLSARENFSTSSSHSASFYSFETTDFFFWKLMVWNFGQLSF